MIAGLGLWVRDNAGAIVVAVVVFVLTYVALREALKQEREER